ncbi:MAG: hypothetical protein GY906_35415 [bacterium]|nr:hypothetical protein [bacterium]
MRQHLVMTVTGRDRTGLVEEVTGLLSEYGGNVEAGRMAKLGGEFVMLLLVTIPAKNLAALQNAVVAFGNENQDDQIEVQVRTTEATTGKEGLGTVCGLTVMGADHAGIIRDIANDLAGRSVNIVTMDTDVSAAPMSGTTLFTMSAVLTLPSGLDIVEFRESMDQLGADVGVEISVLSHSAE